MRDRGHRQYGLVWKIKALFQGKYGRSKPSSYWEMQDRMYQHISWLMLFVVIIFFLAVIVMKMAS